MINNVDETKLSKTVYEPNSSNILKVLDKCTDENFQRK
jgi:hypothetical protein